MRNKYAEYFVLEKQLKSLGYFPDRAEIIKDFTKGKSTSLKGLEDSQYAELIQWIRSSFLNDEQKSCWFNSPENIMRRKLWNIFCKEMGYSQTDFEHWFIKYGKFHRPLKDHTAEQLRVVIPIAEKVLQSFMNATDKRD